MSLIPRDSSAALSGSHAHAEDADPHTGIVTPSTVGDVDQRVHAPGEIRQDMIATPRPGVALFWRISEPAQTLSADTLRHALAHRAAPPAVVLVGARVDAAPLTAALTARAGWTVTAEALAGNTGLPCCALIVTESAVHDIRRGVDALG